MKKYLISMSFLIFAALIIPAFLLYAAEKTVEAPNVEVGEKWIYTDKKGNDLKEAQKARGEEITYVTEKVTDKEIILKVLMGQKSFGKTIYDRQLNLITNPDGNPHNLWKYYPNNANFSFPLQEGKKWTASYKVKTDAWEATYKVNARVVGWEQVTVPAGAFDAIKVVKKVKWQGDRIDRPDNDSDFRSADPGGASKTTFKYYAGEGELTLWYAPEVKAVVKSVWDLNEYPSAVPSSFRVMLSTSDVHIVELADYKRAEETTVALAATPKPVAKETATPAPKSDVDELPAIKAKPNKNSYAIVIGIENYRQKLPKVDYAAHDAKTMTEYLTKVMGYPEENVVTLLNDRALKSDMEKYFEKWLSNNVEEDSTVFVYYSGHGAPNPKTADAYLVPYDGDPSFIDQTGYSLKEMYDALGKLPAKEIIVALDSCFSGAGGRSVIAKGARPLVMSMESFSLPSKIAVLSASSGDQISSTYEEKGHGLFTYFMLKGIKDGITEIGELFNYIKPQVEKIARKVYNNEQSPQLIAPDKKKVFLRE